MAARNLANGHANEAARLDRQAQLEARQGRFSAKVSNFDKRKGVVP